MLVDAGEKSVEQVDAVGEDAALGYNNLLEAERGFRDLKSDLLLRPVCHRLEHRIRAHVLICWLALLLTRVAERSCGQPWRYINRQQFGDGRRLCLVIYVT